MSYALSKYANSALRSNLSDRNEAFFFLDDPEGEGNSDSGFTPKRKSSTNSFSSKEILNRCLALLSKQVNAKKRISGF